VGGIGRRALRAGRGGEAAADRGRRVRVAAHSRESAEYLALCTRDAQRAGDDGTFDEEGAWADHIAFYYPWQFDLADIQAPVSLWHGREDFLPVSHARWLADRIPSVVTHFPPDDDHSNVEANNQAAAFAWLKASVDQN
jgi:hypothetical protein